MRRAVPIVALSLALFACGTSSTGLSGGGGPVGAGNTNIRLTNSNRIPNLRITVDGVRGQPLTVIMPAADVPPYDGPIRDVAIDVQPGDPVSISVTAPGPLANDTTCTAGPMMPSVQGDDLTGFADVLVIVQGGTIAFQCDVPNWQ